MKCTAACKTSSLLVEGFNKVLELSITTFPFYTKVVNDNIFAVSIRARFTPLFLSQRTITLSLHKHTLFFRSYHRLVFFEPKKTQWILRIGNCKWRASGFLHVSHPRVVANHPDVEGTLPMWLKICIKDVPIWR